MYLDEYKDGLMALSFLKGRINVILGNIGVDCQRDPNKLIGTERNILSLYATHELLYNSDLINDVFEHQLEFN